MLPGHCPGKGWLRPLFSCKSHPIPQITWLSPSPPSHCLRGLCPLPGKLTRCFGGHKMPLLESVLGMLISCNYSNLMEETQPLPLEMFSLMGESK